MTTAASERPLEVLRQQADGLGLGIVVVAGVGLLHLDVAELHLVEDVAGELAARARKVRALGVMGGDDPAHPHLRQHRKREDHRQDDQHCGQSDTPSASAPSPRTSRERVG